MQSWWGKIIGFLSGYLLLGPFGGLMGLLLGIFFDRELTNSTAMGRRVAEIFFQALFRCMGYLAKADGAIKPAEIHVARHIMQKMQLNRMQTRRAMLLFYDGKRQGFDIERELERLVKACQRQRNLAGIFLQFQMQAAYADGSLSAEELRILRMMAAYLGIKEAEFVRMQHMFAWSQHSSSQGRTDYTGRGHRANQQSQYSKQQSYTYRPPPPPKDRLAEARRVLGVSPAATVTEIKQAYRRLMNQYHPDKLVAQGLPENMIKVATEKAQAIREAYELLKKASH